MKKVQALTIEVLPAALLPWSLLAAELGVSLFLFASGRVPAVLARSLQLFLRF